MPAQESSKNKRNETPPLDPVAGEPAPADDEPTTAEERARNGDAERMATEAYERFAGVTSRLSERVCETCDAARAYAEKRPGTALLVSFLAGVVLGMITSRR